MPGIRKISRALPELGRSRDRAFLPRRSLSRARSHRRGAHQFSKSWSSDFPESELAGPASYGLAEIFFNEKDYDSARPLFHRAAAKVKASALALSARYFEARCLESLNRKDEARDIYQQVVDGRKSESVTATIRGSRSVRFFSRKAAKPTRSSNSKRSPARRTKAPLKAEATVRAGSLALDLAQGKRQGGQNDDRESNALVEERPRAARRPDAGAESRRSACSGSNIRPAITRRRWRITRRAKTKCRRKCGPR